MVSRVPRWFYERATARQRQRTDEAEKGSVCGVCVCVCLRVCVGGEEEKECVDDFE